MWHQEAGKIRVYNSTSSFKETYRYVFLLFLCSISWNLHCLEKHPWSVLWCCKSSKTTTRPWLRGALQLCKIWHDPAQSDTLETLFSYPEGVVLCSPHRWPAQMVRTNQGDTETLPTQWFIPAVARDVQGFPLVFKNPGSFYMCVWSQTHTHIDTPGCTCLSKRTHTGRHTTTHAIQDRKANQ